MSVRNGEVPLSNRESLRALESVLRRCETDSRSSCQYMIARSAWSRTRWANAPVVSEMTDSALPTGPETTSRPPRVAKTSSSKVKSKVNPALMRVEDFLRDRISAWHLDETLAQLGVDSLDEVQMRTDFQNAFSIKVPMATFVATGQTLGGLCEALSGALSKEHGA